jgi:hypothetical protein
MCFSASMLRERDLKGRSNGRADGKNVSDLLIIQMAYSANNNIPCIAFTVAMRIPFVYDFLVGEWLATRLLQLPRPSKDCNRGYPSELDLA